jgi:3-dehydroquinate dehydratase-2
MNKILLIQGPNMTFLGRREPEFYGTTTAAELDAMLSKHAGQHGYGLEIYYTHVEGEAIARIYEAVDDGVDGLVMNPAGFLYSGYALADCVRAAKLPYVEVHMTNIERRGKSSVLAGVCEGMIFGFGVKSYILGLEAMLHLLENPRK